MPPCLLVQKKFNHLKVGKGNQNLASLIQKSNDDLLYELIISGQLFIYDHNSGEYLTYVEYYGRGWFDDKKGWGTVYFNAAGYGAANGHS
jgi:hypothetical protein